MLLRVLTMSRGEKYYKTEKRQRIPWKKKRIPLAFRTTVPYNQQKHCRNWCDAARLIARLVTMLAHRTFKKTRVPRSHWRGRFATSEIHLRPSRKDLRPPSVRITRILQSNGVGIGLPGFSKSILSDAKKWHSSRAGSEYGDGCLSLSPAPLLSHRRGVGSWQVCCSTGTPAEEVCKEREGSPPRHTPRSPANAVSRIRQVAAQLGLRQAICHDPAFPVTPSDNTVKTGPLYPPASRNSKCLFSFEVEKRT